MALELPVREQYKIRLLDLAIQPTIFIFDKIQFVDSGSVCPFVARLDTDSSILYAVCWSDEFVQQSLSTPTSIIRVYQTTAIIISVINRPGHRDKTCEQKLHDGLIPPLSSTDHLASCALVSCPNPSILADIHDDFCAF